MYHLRALARAFGRPYDLVLRRPPWGHQIQRLPGWRLDQLGSARLVVAMRALGGSLARLHQVPGLLGKENAARDQPGNLLEDHLRPVL